MLRDQKKELKCFSSFSYQSFDFLISSDEQDGEDQEQPLQG